MTSRATRAEWLCLAAIVAASGGGGDAELVVAEPEPLAPQMQLTAAMLIDVIARGGDVFEGVGVVHDPGGAACRDAASGRRRVRIAESQGLDSRDALESRDRARRFSTDDCDDRSGGSREGRGV